MSLKSFQEALAEIITSPQIGKTYGDDPALLDQKYTLSEKEKLRLLDMIGQKGMRANYMLYQMNRLTPLTMFMAYTLKILQPRLMHVLRAFWAAYPRPSFQFKDELQTFSSFLWEQIAKGAALFHLLEDVLRVEDAINDIRFDTGETSLINDEFFTLHPGARLVHLEHDAAALVEAMVTYDAAQPPAVPEAPGYYVLYYDGRLRTYPIEAPAAEALLAQQPIEEVPEELVEAGVLV